MAYATLSIFGTDEFGSSGWEVSWKRVWFKSMSPVCACMSVDVCSLAVYSCVVSCFVLAS